MLKEQGMKTTYKNAVIITGNISQPFIKSGYLSVDESVICRIGRMSDLEIDAGECVIDLHGKIISPGMISTHCHFYGQFVRGLSIKQPILNWQQVLSRMWWRVDKALDEEMIYYSTMMGLIEGLKCGTTTYFDHHASPNCIDGSLDIIQEAMTRAGARGCLAYEVSDRDGKERADAGLRENERFIRKNNLTLTEQNQFKGLIGMHASYTIGRETLEECSEKGRGLDCGFHIHVAEAKADISDSYKLYDQHVVERLANAGILGDNSIAAHCVHIGENERKILRNTRVTVAHNCQSNINNAVGIAPVGAMLNEGVRVTLGGDGYSYDLFNELGFAAIMQRLDAKSPAAFSADQIWKLGFMNSQILANQIFGYPLGILKIGALADFVVLDYNQPTPLYKENILSHLLSGMGAHVDTVVIDGKVVVKEGKCTMLDEKEIFQKCRHHARRLWEKF